MDPVNGAPAEHRPVSAASNGHSLGNGGPRSSRALAEVLRETGASLESSCNGSDTQSEEDYDENVRPAYSTGHQRQQHQPRARFSNAFPQEQPAKQAQTNMAIVRDATGTHIIPEDDGSIQELLLRSSRHFHDPKAPKRKGRFSDLVFTHQYSTFDSNNIAASSSPFHGFYTLFWLAISLMILKIFASNWRDYGTPLGSNEIMHIMFSRDVAVMLLSDGVMCGLGGVSWALQKLVFARYIDWDRSGWILQNIWQTVFFTGVVGWTLVRDWPWTHTVFFVLHGLVMLMKQHSYAFYNGYLSTVYHKRLFLLSRLKQLELVAPATGPSTTAPSASTISVSHLDAPPSAEQRRLSLSHSPSNSTEETDIDRIARAISTRQPLDDEQIDLFERIIKWEVDALADELRGTASDPCKFYPNNLTLLNYYKWIPLPTVVYELDYPRCEKVRWQYVAEKSIAMVGIIFVMIQVSQYFIYPVVMKTIAMKENGLTLTERFREFPWMLLDLIFPFMMEYLLVWYLIWETILNILAELTGFADRSFYGPWWNSVSWDQFARDWNTPVHVFLLRHVYHSSISSMKVNKHTATLITFFFSACIHELVMWCLFKKLRGYLLFFQMCQLPLVRLSRTRWLKGRKTLGNLMFWAGIFLCPSLLCSLYLIL
ncbi:hypothetical protein CDD81_6332 [Ophiocordyceps australis]|uniref:O-acyltransferase n=1 Tax=Ophiocordyceps australis TaxID=1399860 RepID=A0A2C5Y325_9HYPO|nr:hypothetical protein CDD81_6332 [Ophiocordyceps australis]